MTQKEKKGWNDKIKKLTKVRCPKCKSVKVYRFGSQITSNGKVQRYQCQKCGHVWRDE